MSEHDAARRPDSAPPHDAEHPRGEHPREASTDDKRLARRQLLRGVAGVGALAFATLAKGPVARAEEDSSTDGDSRTCRVPAGHANPVTEDAPGTYTFTVPDGVTRIRVSAWGAGGGGGRGTSEMGAAGGGGGGYASTTLVVSPGMQFKYTVGKGGWAESRVSPAAAGGATVFSVAGTEPYPLLRAGGGGAASDGKPGAGGTAQSRNLDFVMQNVAHEGGSGAGPQGITGGGGGGSAGHGGGGGNADGHNGGYGGDGGALSLFGAFGGDGGGDGEAGGAPGEPGAGGGGSGRVTSLDPLGQGSDVGGWGGDGRIRIALCP